MRKLSLDYNRNCHTIPFIAKQKAVKQKERSTNLINNRQREDKIQKLSSDYIYQEAVGSLLLLLMSSLEEADTHEAVTGYAIHEDILNIRKEVTDFVLGLEELLNADKEERSAALEKCLNLRKSLTKIYGNIYRYYASWNIISSSLNDEVALRKYHEENVSAKQLEFELFYKDCFEFLQSADTFTKQKNYMGQLLKCIPFKMTRDSYFDFIKSCLETAFEGQSEKSITVSLETFEQACAPETFSDYGKYFAEIAQWIGEKKALKPSDLTDEELDEEYADFHSVFETLTEIEDYLSAIFNDLNSLIILFYLGFSFEELTEKEFAYSDLYHSVCEILTGKADEVTLTEFIQRVHNLLEEHVEPIIDKANELNKAEYKLLEKLEEDYDFSEETAKTLASESFIRSYYYSDINEELFQFDIEEGLPVASKEFRERKFSEFVERMRRYFSPLPMQVRKTAMQMLLGSLPPAWSVEQILDKLKEAIESAPSFEHKVLIVDKAGMVFNDNGFHYHTGEEEAFIENSHDCGCSEHHHHDHNCNCSEHHH